MKVAHRAGTSLAARFGLALLALVLMVSTSCAGRASVSPDQRRSGEEFTRITDEFIRTSGLVSDAIDRANAGGDFVPNADHAASLLLASEQTVSRMEQLTPSLHPSLADEASELASAARAWNAAALEAITAGRQSDAVAYAQAVSEMNRQRERFNLSVRRWNLAIQGA